MQKLYVSEIVIRVNSNLLTEFYETTNYLTLVRRKCGNYNNSIPFKYIINQFNSEFNSYPKEYWINEINQYNSKLKKDKRICIWIMNKPYITFMNNCNKLQINRAKVIRALMLKLIEQYESERVG